MKRSYAMTKILGLYHSVRDIGKHESCYKKIGDFSDGSITVIVRSISGKGATVSFNDKEIPLEEGMILGKKCDFIYTFLTSKYLIQMKIFTDFGTIVNFASK